MTIRTSTSLITVTRLGCVLRHRMGNSVANTNIIHGVAGGISTAV